MARTTVVQNSFNAGELSPLMGARVDQARYANGCRTLRNMLVHPHGGAWRRPGFRFMGNCHGKGVVRLVPFVFSETQTYVLEFSHERIRVWSQGGLVLGASGQPVEVQTPWQETQLGVLRWCQSADVLYLVSPFGPPRKLERRSHTDWRLVTVTFAPGIAPPANLRTAAVAAGARTWRYVVTAMNSITGEESLPTAEIAVTGPDILSAGASLSLAWNPVPGASEYRVYRAGGGTKVYGYVGTAAAGESFTDTGLPADFKSGPPEARTPFAAEGDWPTCAVFWQQRLCFAGSRNSPQTIWASRSGVYENFGVSRPLREDDAVTVTIAADTVSAVRWMMPSRRLLIGTGGGEWTLSGQGSQPFSALSCQLERQAARGGADMPPLAVGDGVIAVQRGGQVVREYRYSFDVDGYAGADLTLLAEHILQGRRIVDWAWQQAPASTVWCVLSDGTLAGMTLVREQDVTAWHTHVTNGWVESVCVIPGVAGDELWAVIRRTSTRGEQRCMERLDPPFSGTDLRNAFFVDSGLSYNGAPVTRVAGLEHLEGKEVHILADGTMHPPQKVRDGAIRLERAASRVHVGLGYASDLEPMTPEFVAPDGGTQTRQRRTGRVRVRLYRSMGLWAGVGPEQLREHVFRTVSEGPVSEPTAFTGDVELALDSHLATQGGVWLRQNAPLPFTVLAVASEVEVGDA